MDELKIKQLVSEYLSKKGLPVDLALTFDDVVIVDQYSEIKSRSDISDTKTEIAKGVFINAPVISSNMATVSEYEMAIAMARVGGIGTIHQFLTLEEKLNQIDKVKRADGILIEDPISIYENQKLRHARNLMKENQISGLLITDGGGKLINILTNRDIQFEERQEILIRDILPKRKILFAPQNIGPEEARNLIVDNLIVSRPDTTLEQAKKVFQLFKIEKLPIINENHEILGIMTSKDLKKRLAYPLASRDDKGRLMVSIAVGVNTPINEIEELVKAEVDVLTIDTARGFSKLLVDKIKEVKKRFPDLPVLAGVIDTPEGTEFLIKVGADGIKVGIGPGSACKTRLITGIGLPQLSAIAECYAVAKEYKVPIIGDGGIRNSGDLAKTIAAGASGVIVGGLLAGSEETPGRIFSENGQQWKMYQGSASAEFQFKRNDRDVEFRTPEGEPMRVPFKGEVSGIIEELLGGLKSSMSYVGAKNLGEFKERAKFRQQSLAGYKEGETKNNINH